MRRTARINRDWWKARAIETPAMAIAGIFIAVSGMMSVTFGYRLGEPSGNALVFAAFAIAVEGFADLSVPLFWRRLGLVGRGLLIVFFALCLAYKLEAAKKFAAENLGKREAAVATATQGYDIAQANVERLRKEIADNADARGQALIQSEIDGLLLDKRAEGCTGTINGEITAKVCPQVAKLRGELARAKARDDAQAALTPALAEWRALAPAGHGSAGDSIGPIAALLMLFGVTVASWSGLIASLIMVICEAGAIVVPMLMGFAFGDGKRPAPKSEAQEPAPGRKASPAEQPAGDAAAPVSLPAGLTERTRRDIADVTAFLAHDSERASGERVQSSTLYFVYSQWKTERGETAMTVAQFGVVLTRHLGMGKIKSDGKNWYLGLRLRHPGQGRKGAKHLQAVAA
jgi:hypothetical protein